MPDPYPVVFGRDRAALESLTEMQAQLSKMIDGFYRRGPGCACDAVGLCAYHAQAADLIRAAQQQLKRTHEYMLSAE